MSALGVGAQVGVLLPYSRAHEAEADRIGLDLMARAGFDPKAAVDLWRNMERSAKGATLAFLSTHPSHGQRIDALSRDMPAAERLYRDALAAGHRPACR
jgi:predicted Zn-dependent protease